MTGFRAELALALVAGVFLSAAAAPNPAVNKVPPPAAEPFVKIPTNAPIEESALGSPEPPAGLLTASNGGMAADIWSGSERAAIEDLLARLPLATPVHSVHQLARKLILTTADAPPGPAPHAFQTLRVQALLNAGLVGEAAKLAAQVQLPDNPEFTNLQAQAILLGGKPADACGDATKERDTESQPLWMQLRAYCEGAAGQTDLLELTRGVMKAQGADDRAFEILLDDVLQHKATPPGQLHDPTAVQVFLMRQAGIPVNPSLAARFGIAASILALGDPKNPPMARADAAAQAIHTGAISAAELGAVADAQLFAPQQLASVETAAQGLPFFLGQSLIRQAVAQAADDADKARLLAVAFRAGHQAGLSPVAAAIQEKALTSLPASSISRAFTRSFAQALLLAHQADAAERWRDILDPNGADAPLAASLAVELELAAPNAGRAARAQTALSFLAQTKPIPDRDFANYAALALALYGALGEPMPADAKARAEQIVKVQGEGRQIPPLVLKHLHEMIGHADRKGEAVLSILDTVGVQGPGDLAANDAYEVVHGLAALGETEAARAFAVDALLLYQPPPQGPVPLIPTPLPAAQALPAPAKTPEKAQ